MNTALLRPRMVTMAVGASIETNITNITQRELDQLCTNLTKHLGMVFKYAIAGDKANITRLADVQIPASERASKYVFSDMQPGQSRDVDVPVTRHPGVRRVIREIAERHGMRFRTTERAGVLVVTRVDGTELEGDARPPFEATAPGGSFDVGAGIKVSSLRVQAVYYGKKLGCRFSVRAKADGGWTVTRSGAPAGASVAPAPAPKVAAPPPKIAPPSFDEEEF